MTKRTRYANLGEFISRLESEGELVRITRKVSTELEITAITDRGSKLPGGGKALLFENVEGSGIPVLINAYGSERRMAMALGVDDVEEIAAQIKNLLTMAPPESMADKLRMLPVLLGMTRFPPRKTSGKAPCQEVVLKNEEVDLSILPVLKCWPGDAGKFITFSLVVTEGLDGRRNLGMYRMQIFDKNTTGMHWHIHKDGARHFHEYAKAGKKMPVSVAIGTDPVVTYCATAPLPPGVDEFLLAGLIRQAPVKLVRCITNDLWIPAESEMVLEGYVDPAEPFRLEGPFGDHTGYYSLADYYPAFHITAITMRKDPVYFTTIVGKPPMEDCYMGRATSRIFLPMLGTVTSELADYDLPWEGVFHNCVIVAMEKNYPAAAQKLMHTLWGTGQMAFAKMILAVDDDVPVRDYGKVFRTFLDNFDMENDLFYSEGILDVLDHSSPEPMRGSKLGIDATRRIASEKPRKPAALLTVEEGAIRRNMLEYGVRAWHMPEKETMNRVIICSLEKKSPGQVAETAGNLLSGEAGGMANIFVMVDGNIDPEDLSVVAWKVFNNTDPKRDIIRRGKGLIVDATKKTPLEGHKREWPDDIEMDRDVEKKVESFWPELGIDDGTAS